MSDESSPSGIQKNGGPKVLPVRQDKSSVTVSKFIVILGGVVAILLVIVNNSVTVDNLAIQIGSLDSTYKEIKFRNDSLQAELRKLSSAERITKIASERLGLVYSSQTLDKIEIDKEKLNKAQQADAADSSK